jgi:exosortase E/protease (VPEID-CTERM system)
LTPSCSFAVHGLAKATVLGALVTLAASLFLRRDLILARDARPWARSALQCVVWLALLAVITALPSGAPDAPLTAALTLHILGSSALLVAYAGATLLLFLPVGSVFRQDRRLPGIGLIALFVYAGQHIYAIWLQTALRGLIEGITLDLSLWFHAFLSADVPIITFNEAGIPILSGGGFAIAMHPSCAGYQGLLTAFLLLGAYLVFDRKALRLKPAVLLALHAMALVFLMNALRIALLFEIGVRVSSEIAVEGFHSNFGTLSVFAVVAAAMLVLNHPFFRRPTEIARVGQAAWSPKSSPPPVAPAPSHDVVLWQLTPLALMLTAMLASGVFVGAFNWLYPVPILVGALALWPIRSRVLETFSAHISSTAVLAGLAVYLAWIAIVPRDAERAELIVTTLEGAPLLLAVGWILVRILGSGVVVPILEELAFRGGLMHLLRGQSTGRLSASLTTVLALLATSLMFGLMHGAIVAATIAGLVYGLVALHRGLVGDAIVAHAVTNLLIAVHVLVFADWSLW